MRLYSNDIKHELNLCLRSEVRTAQRSSCESQNTDAAPFRLVQRIDRTKQNREEAKQKRAKVQKMWAEIDEES